MMMGKMLTFRSLRLPRGDRSRPRARSSFVWMIIFILGFSECCSIGLLNVFFFVVWFDILGGKYIKAFQAYPRIMRIRGWDCPVDIEAVKTDWMVFCSFGYTILN
jgi:hypothetical protein